MNKYLKTEKNIKQLISLGIFKYSNEEHTKTENLKYVSNSNVTDNLRVRKDETEESVNSVQKKIMEIIYSKPRMKIINENVGFIHATDVTPFFRFYDDLAIKIFEQEGKTIVWMQSQSRLGYYDFQVNEKRIQQLHKEFLLL